jgi:hypothetical protein
MAQYVAYVDMGNGVGSKVDPEDHGGEDSDDFQYMLERRTVVPIGDPDASIAMGKAPEAAADEKDAELAALRARVAELEAAAAAVKPAAGGGGGGSASSASTPASGSGGGAGSSSGKATGGSGSAG